METTDNQESHVPNDSVPRNRRHCLRVEHFAQISSATVNFGDLTVLVGPQATGKSLLLQLLKLSLDRPVIAHQLRKYGFSWPKGASGLASTFLGEGYEECFSRHTEIHFGGEDVLKERGRSSSRDPSVFFVPAQRVVSISNGWPRPFTEYGPGDPFVVKEFSQRIFEFFGRGLGKDGAPIFPNADRLKAPIRKSIENSIFHGGTLALRRDGPRTELRLQYPQQHADPTKQAASNSQVSLPFLEWSAGQREFTPLLLGLYELLPGGRVSKHSTFRWAIIEEPEMGLHPSAINSVMLLIFELIYRGYRVALSTHAPYVLDLVWAIQALRQTSSQRRAELLLEALGNKHGALKPVASRLFDAKIKVYALGFDDSRRYQCVDISSLDPSDENKDVAGWGGVTALSGVVARAVAKGA